MRLYSITYSPWSIQARWALNFHKMSYEIIHFTPLLTGAQLRLEIKQFGGQISVPTMIDKGQVLTDSFDIAQYADFWGSAELIPSDFLPEIRATNALAHKLANAGRALVTTATLNNPEALRANLPSFVPKGLRKSATPLATAVAKYLAKKYGFDPNSTDVWKATQSEALLEIRQALNGREYLLGDRFTYADIVVAAALNFILPVNEKYVQVSEINRQTWSDPALADEFSDLFSWRDSLFERHWAPRLRR